MDLHKRMRIFELERRRREKERGAAVDLLGKI
jgi:hypothetical protein